MARRLWLMGVAALLLVPASVYSLGLGEIRLDSFLNEPLNAEIPIALAPGDELASLKVAVASRAAFERFGIDRPDFLDDLRFRIEQRAGGAAVLHVSSTRPIREPFVTFLIEADYAGGRILREYTVLLDPPVFVQGRQQVVPAAPVPQAPAEGAIARPAPARPAPAAAAPSPAAQPPAAQPPVSPPQAAAPAREAGVYGPVRRNETLWGIAQTVRPAQDVTMNQAMVALFNANPAAFDGNINRLRAGVTLRVPTRQEMLALTASQASAEVRSQNRAWRGEVQVARERAPSPAPTPRPTVEPEAGERLELVPPGQAEAPAAAVGEPAAGADYIAEQEALNEELLTAVQGMRRELEETRQLISVKDAEIAALQDRLSSLEGQPATVATEPPAAEAPAVRAEPEPRPAAPPPAVIVDPETDGGLFGSVWLWVLVLIAAAGAAWAVMRRRSEGPVGAESYEAWTAAATAGAGAGAIGRTATGAALAAGAAREEDESFVVEEQRAPATPRPAPKPRPAARERAEPESEEGDEGDEGEEAGGGEEKAYKYPFEDTIAGATGINLEQSDPLAEADFHMAYGLYDQAAELVGKAIEREPDRADLRMKMLDILFVWGRGDEFLEQARAFREMGADPADWRRVVIMGRQICPGESLFEDASVATGADIEAAEGEEAPVDFEVGETRSGAESLDFELESTGERLARKAEPKPDETAELEIEDLGLDMDFGEDTRETRSARDTGLTEMMERAEEGEDEEPAPETGLTEILEREEEESEDTGLTAMLRRPEAEEDESEVTATEVLHGRATVSETETREAPRLEEEPSEPVADVEEDDTAEVRVLDEEEAGELELDDLTRALSADLDSTAEMRSPEDEAAPDSDTLMQEIFGDEAETRIAPGRSVGPDEDATREMPTPTDVTLSEVGTKLDLARAYIDMGDPAGARTILDEVLNEGDEDQKKEARQLIEGLD